MPCALAIVNRFMNHTSSSGADLRQAAALLADEVVFKGLPIQTVRDAHIGLPQQLLPSQVSARVLRQLGGDEVCSVDELTVRTPTGNTVTLSMVEWLKLRRGRIAEHSLYYEPRESAAAFGVAG